MFAYFDQNNIHILDNFRYFLIIRNLFLCSQKKVGKPEFIGRAIGKPHIQLCEDPYAVPKLEWFQIYRGTEEAGELLSAFEMFEVIFNVLMVYNMILCFLLFVIKLLNL